MGPQAGQQAAQRASRAASQNAQRNVQWANAQAHQAFVRNMGRGRRSSGRRHSLPVRLVGGVFRLVFVAIWLVVAVSIVAFAVQQSKGR